mmetsp:Transcript_48721/g.130413  ORF Transcript_48721/g.130413 Transcript_48721/m.130413 type:complete len:290 (+) Transcript_48721:742-1611(+)
MHADHVQDENVTTPGRDHVAVGDAREQPKRPRAGGPHGAQPEPERSAYGSDCDGLVVKLAAHRAHEVRGDDGHDSGGHEACVHTPGDLVRQEARGSRRDGAEPWRHHATDVVDAHWSEADRLRELGQVHKSPLLHRVDDWLEGLDRIRKVDGGDRDVLHALPDRHGGHLHAWVDGCTDGSAQRVPRLVVIPLEELGEPVLGQVLCGAVVEPRVELMDDHPKVLDGVQANVVGRIEEVEAKDNLDRDDADLEAQAYGQQGQPRVRHAAGKQGTASGAVGRTGSKTPADRA